MEVASRCIGLVMIAWPLVPEATAQTSATRQSLSGVVRESPARAAGRRISVCVAVPAAPQNYQWKCADVDSVGAYRLDSLPSVRMQFSVNCEAVRWFSALLASDSILIPGGESMRRDWQVSTAGCDSRPLRRITGEFRGHYVGGFEASEFRPCPKDAWFVPDDSLDLYPFDNRRAWATWSDRAGQSVRWPRGAPEDPDGNPRYYVRWRGTVVGPGHYGHMGISAFEFFVDSVLEVRVPAALDCR